MSVRLAVDIGGTFTDAVLDDDGARTSCKVLTTPARPAEGFMAAVDLILAESGVAPAAVGLILHGTTLATNALIERKGAKTALIVTEGHRDSLEMAYENRFDQYDIDVDRPPPLVARSLRLPVIERLDSRGRVLTALDEASVAGVIETLRSRAIESVAVGLLHAYANPVHEERVAALIAAALPAVSISLSAHVCPEIREYERQSTICANAYVQPLMAGYLGDLERRLDARGFTCPCLLMTSGGHLVTIRTASDDPIRLVESGPAGGAILASHLAGGLGEDQVLSFDMGGTTAKICLIDGGEPLLSRSFEVGRAHRFMKGSGLPVRIPVVEMVEIGAGGGSVASVDALRRITVGPESAGSDPGPACYGLGGDRATVTDANLVLGRLDADDFAGGSLRLDEAAARRSIAADVGERLSLQAAEGARGILEIVDENMANAARVHAVERGKDIAGRTMIAFGGAAPLHAARIAEKLAVGRVLVPRNAGVGSAVGFLLAPVAYEVVRSRYTRLDRFDAGEVGALFAEMEQEASAVVRLGAPEADLTIRRHAYARYVGQGHEVKIELPAMDAAGGAQVAIRRAFETAYERHYGRLVPGLDVEVLTWSAIVSGPSAAAGPAGQEVETTTEAVSNGSREIHFSGNRDALVARVCARCDIEVGQRIIGPAAVTEPQTTTIVPTGWTAALNAAGDLILAPTSQTESAGPSDGDRGDDRGDDLGDAIGKQVLWDRFIAIVEEQAQAIIRTAFSTTVREAGDLSAGLFDRRGRMLAQAVTGTPGHVNAMAASVRHFLDRYPIEAMAAGDVYVTNDPWLGTGHLFDFTVVTPVFRDHNAVALFASTVHVVDIGGPGFGPDSGQVFEEGLCIPILPMFRAGAANEDLFEIVRANVREPVQVVGDLYSLAASNHVGERRLLDLMAEFGLADLAAIGDHIIETSRDAMMDEIGRLPAGTYANDMVVDGYDRPVRLAASLRVSDDGIAVDFDGTSAVSNYGINVPLSYTEAYTSFGVRCLVGNRIPNNSGSLEPIQVTAPEDCILNARRPAAVAVRHVIGQMLPDLVLGCLEQAVPAGVPAEGASSLWNPMLAGGRGLVADHDYGDATPFSVTIFHSGGTGARPTKDGLSATAFPSGVRNTPVEITESLAPVLYLRKEYREDSGGKGRTRGGDGQIIVIEHAEGAPFAVFALFDRIDHPARGRAGGEPGAAGRIALASGKALKGKGKQIVPAGDRLVLELPGGGGLGPCD